MWQFYSDSSRFFFVTNCMSKSEVQIALECMEVFLVAYTTAGKEYWYGML
jgi:hypothetical protein